MVIVSSAKSAMQSGDQSDLNTDAVQEFVRQAQPDTARSLVDLFVWCWSFIFAAIGLFLYSPQPLTFAIAFLTLTSRSGALLALAHEAHHSALLPNKRWNDLIGAWFCAYPVGSVYGSSRAVHMAHHKFLNTADDPDMAFHREADKASPRQFVFHFARLVLGGQLWTSIVVNGLMRPQVKQQNGNAPQVVVNRRGHPEIINLLLVQFFIFCALWAASGEWWLYAIIWFAPIATLGTFFQFMRGFVDHAKLASDESGAAKYRLCTVRQVNSFERAFLAPFDFNYHGEHHMFPTVPHYLLPKLHKLMQSDRRYSRQYGVRLSYSRFLTDYWRQISGDTRPAAADL